MGAEAMMTGPNDPSAGRYTVSGISAIGQRAYLLADGSTGPPREEHRGRSYWATFELETLG